MTNGVIKTDTTGNDSVTGTNYNDTLYGSVATGDTMNGGAGNDTYYVYNTGDIITDTSGTNTVYDFVNGYNMQNMANGVENIIVEGNTSENYNSYYDIKYATSISGGYIYLEGETATKVNTAITVYGDPMGWGISDVSAINPKDTDTYLTVNSGNLDGPNKLDYSQGDDKQGYTGDCGIVSCENVLIETGILGYRTNYSPGTGIIDPAETYIVGRANQNIQDAVQYQGGTYYYDQVEILANEGLAATAYNANLTGLAQEIKSGYAVIAEIDAYQIWYGISDATRTQREYADHAITVTGVAYSGNTIEGFYICDSGSGMYLNSAYGGNSVNDSARFVDTALMTKAFDLNTSRTLGACGVIVCSNTPKEDLDNWSATSNNANDVITGNGGNDTLTAGAGADTINGGAGNNLIIAGSGSDYINGNLGSNVYQFSPGFGNDIISDRSGNNTLDFSKFGNTAIAVDLSNPTTPFSNGNSSITLQNYVYDVYNNTVDLNGNITTNNIPLAISVPTVITGVNVGSGNDTITAGGSVNYTDALGDSLTEGGSDTITGGSGNDTYIIPSSAANNFGSLLIKEAPNVTAGNNTLNLNNITGVTAAQNSTTGTYTIAGATFEALNNGVDVSSSSTAAKDLEILITNTNNSIVIDNYFDGAHTLVAGAVAGTGQIENIQFNNSTLHFADIVASGTFH